MSKTQDLPFAYPTWPAGVAHQEFNKTMAARRHRNFDHMRVPPVADAKAGTSPELEMAGKKWRVPEDAPDEIKQMAAEALKRMYEAMNGYYSPQVAASIVAAAKAVRAEICGAPATNATVNVKGQLGVLGIVAKMDEAAGALPVSTEKPALPPAQEEPLVEPPADPGLPQPRVVARPPIIHRKAKKE